MKFFIIDNFTKIKNKKKIDIEYPFFSLKRNEKIRTYKDKNITIITKPNFDGTATIFDKDILIYAISKLKKEIKEKKKNRIVVFSIYDFLLNTEKKIGGKTYKELKNALYRLSGTRIETKITHSKNKEEITEFGLIDSWKFFLKNKGKIKKKS